MPDILLRSGDLYIKKVQSALYQQLDMNTVQRIFPSLDESDGTIIRQLIQSLLDLTPMLGNLVADTNNLPHDRCLSALAFTYMIMPFDILPHEQYGLLGYLDDALVIHELVAEMIEPDKKIEVLSTDYRNKMNKLMTKLPTWFTNSINTFTSQACEQNRLLQDSCNKNRTPDNITF